MKGLLLFMHATHALSAVALSLLGATALAASETERGACAAGGVKGFGHYSDALRRSGVIWDRQYLDAGLTNPASVVFSRPEEISSCMQRGCP